ncbi:MAG: DUF4124 domain-containing protein [Pseudomonadota bacterium]
MNGLPPRLVLAVVLSMATLSVGAATYRYVDDKGRVIYSDTMPPQQAGKGHQELAPSGRVVREVERVPLTEEERRRAEAARREAEEAKRRALEAQRRDRALLSSYTSEAEIDLVRDRALELEQLRITSLETQMNYASEKLAKANAAIAKRPDNPAKVHLQMREEAQSDLTGIALHLAQARKNLEAIRVKYDADKQRYRELKGLR